MDLDRNTQRVRQSLFVNAPTVITNGHPTEAKLPYTIEEFLAAQGLLPRSVVVEHNGHAATARKLATLQGWALALSSGHAGLE